MRSLVGVITRRVSNITIATVLAFSSIAASLPLIFSQSASATASSTPSVHSVRFSTTQSTYKGIVVDSYVKDFTDATGIEITIHRADGSSVTREGGTDTLNHINTGGNKALTIPFNFAGSSSGSWFSGQNALWLPSQTPTGVSFKITKRNSETYTYSTPTSQTLVEKNGLYTDLIPTYTPLTTISIDGSEDGLVGAEFTVRGEATSATGLNRVYVQLVHRESGTRYGGTTINLLPNGTSAQWSRTYRISDKLPEGTYAAHAQVVAKNGQRMDTGWTQNFKLDTTMPSFAITSPANNSVVNGERQISAVIADANDITKVLINVGDGKGNYSWELGKAERNIYRSGNTFSLNIDTKTLPNGPVHVVLRATDSAGNTRYYNNNAGNRQHVFTVDNSAPTAPTITAPVVNEEFESTVRSIRAEWEPSLDDNEITQYQIEYVYTRDGVVTTDYREVTGNKLHRDQKLSGNVLSDFTIRVRALDIAGNWSEWSAPVTYYYGVQKPNPEEPNNPNENSGNTGGNQNNNNTNQQPNTPDAVPNLSGGVIVAGLLTPLIQVGTIQQSNTNSTTPSDVLAAQTTLGDIESDGEVQAANTTSDNTDDNEDKGCGKFLGLCWYWWIVIVVGILLAYGVFRASGREDKSSK